jgi:hypothetical protein
MAREYARESVAERVTMAQGQAHVEPAAATDGARIAREQVKYSSIEVIEEF